MSRAAHTRAIEASVLRDTFDQSFSRRALTNADTFVDTLAIRVGGDPWLVRVADIQGIHARPVLTRVPTDYPTFLGLVGLRGVTVPVFDLAGLLGYPTAPAPAWLLLAGTSEPIALGVDVFEAHARLLCDAESSLSSGLVTVEGILRRVLPVPSLIKSLRNRTYD
jgi:chemotaxis signal transduction protein